MSLPFSRAAMKLALALALGFAVTANSDESPLIRSDAVVLKLDGANLIIKEALKKAAEMNLSVNISVVDTGGHLLGFARMDDARPASIYTSMSKASSAALKLGDTGTLGNPEEQPNVHLNLAVENAAMMSGGKFTTLEGGVAIVVNGKVIGGIGVGGAKGTEDAEIAKAGLAALNAALKLEDK